MATRAVLWDLGNVLIDWQPARLYRNFFDTEAQVEAFLSHVCTMAWHTEHDRGVPMAKNRVHLIEQYPEHAEAITAWEHRIEDMLDGCVDGTPEAIDALAARDVPQYALTNMPDEWIGLVHERYPSMRHMRDVIVSAHEGCVKPDRRIFEITAERLPHAPSEVLFFDDSVRNIAAAREFGFDAEQFTGADAMMAALKDRKLLD